MADLIPVDINKLLQQLNNTGLQSKDQPLYQLLKQIVSSLAGVNKAGGAAITNISTSSGKIISSAGVPGFDGADGEDGFPVPGPPGINGATGAGGPVGPSIVDTEVIEDFITTLVGPQGNPGPTGSQGPVSAIWPLEDGLDGEDGFPGPPGIAGASGSSDIAVQSTKLSNSDILTLSSVPITVVSAPGANKIAVPIAVGLQKNWVTGYSVSRNLSLRYAGSTLDITSATAFANTAAIQAARLVILTLTSTDAVDVSNTAVVLRSSGDVTGGNAANYIDVTVVYAIMSSN